MQTRCWFQCFTGPKPNRTRTEGKKIPPEKHAAGRRKKILEPELAKKTPREETRNRHRRPRRTSKTPLSGGVGTFGVVACVQEVAVTPGELVADADLVDYTMCASERDEDEAIQEAAGKNRW